MTARDDYPEIANLTGYKRPIIDTKLRLELQRALDEIDRLRALEAGQSSNCSTTPSSPVNR